MTLRDFVELGRADDDWSLETEALQIAGFETGAEDYGADSKATAAAAADEANDAAAADDRPNDVAADVDDDAEADDAAAATAETAPSAENVEVAADTIPDR